MPEGGAPKRRADGSVDFDDVQFQAALKGAVAGDEDSFAELYRAFQPMLRRVLSGLVGPDDAADIGSTVWLEVLRNLAAFAGDTSGFRAWICTIARHRTIDLRRARDRHPETPAPVEDIDLLLPEVSDPADAAATASSTGDAIDLIRRLPADQAEVVLLRVVADLDVDTVARIVGKRPGHVRVLSHRGLRRLADLTEPATELQDDENEPTPA
jgi:RNA polymerase sigma-70 factor (ECF subfamily)